MTEILLTRKGRASRDGGRWLEIPNPRLVPWPPPPPPSAEWSGASPVWGLVEPLDGEPGGSYRYSKKRAQLRWASCCFYGNTLNWVES